MKFFLKIFVILALTCVSAFAQTGTPTKQSGNVTPRHAACWTTNGVIQDCGTAAIPYTSSLGTVGPGPTMCAWTALVTSGAAQQICLGGTTSGGAEIYVQNSGTAPVQPLTLDLNGTLYQFPFTGMGAGNVVGPNSSTVGDLALWNNNNGTLLKDSSVSAFFDAVCSSTIGQLWVRLTGGWGCTSLGFVNPVWYGAKGDGITVDTSAFTAATTAAAGLNIGMVLISTAPTNTAVYCTPGWTAAAQSIRIVFTVGNNGGAQLSSCGSTLSPLELNGFASTLEHGFINGPGFVSGSAPTNPALLLGSGCVECFILDPRIEGGNHAVQVNAGDVHIIGGHYESSYGAVIFVANGGAYMQRMKRDQNYPTASICSSQVNWSASLSVTANECLTLTSHSNFVVQVTTGGTTGGSEPAPANYGTAISDGSTVKEALLKPANYYALECDSNSGCYDSESDETGPYDYGIAQTNVLGGGASQTFVIDRTITGNELVGGIYLNAGAAASITNSQISACARAGCNGILFDTSYLGSFQIIGNRFFSNSGTNIQFNSGGSVSGGVIADNQILGGAVVGIGFDAATSAAHIDAHDNIFNSPIWGSPTNGIAIANGVGDLNIHANDLSGTSTPITSPGNTATNRITDNIGYNPVGATAATNVGTSPATITAGPSPETHYLNQSATNTATVTVGGQKVATLAGSSTYYPIDLGPNEAMVVTWATTTPTDTKYVH